MVGSGTLVLYPSPLSSTVPSRGPQWLLVLSVEGLGGGDILLGIDWRSAARKRSYLLELYFWGWKEGGHVMEVLPGKGWNEKTESCRRQEPGPGDTHTCFRAGTKAGDHEEKCCLHGPTEPIQEGLGVQG